MDPSRSSKASRSNASHRSGIATFLEHSSAMIATLSPAGKFLYANPAWKRCFELDHAALMALDSFHDLFESGIRGEAAALFRRALDGEAVERAPLRHHTPDGRVIELELSLSRRQKAGKTSGGALPAARRNAAETARKPAGAAACGEPDRGREDASGESAGMRILEALCISQGWDVAIQWVVDAEQKHLEFGTAWGAPGRRAEALIQASMVLTLEGGSELPERAWKDGRPVWVTDLALAPPSPRVAAALDAGDGFGLGGACARRQQAAGGAGVLLPFPAARRPRGDGRGGDGGRLAGTDAGADPGTRAGRRVEPPAGRFCSIRWPTASAGSTARER